MYSVISNYITASLRLLRISPDKFDVPIKCCQALMSSTKSKVPDAPSWNAVDVNSLPEVPGIDLALVEQLERISLVELNNEEGLRLLKNAVKSATKLHQVNTEGVEPLVSVLEDRELWMRPDEITEGNCAQEILQNAAVTEEGYFVAPPGNIPLKKKSKEHLSKLLDPSVDDGDS